MVRCEARSHVLAPLLLAVLVPLVTPLPYTSSALAECVLLRSSEADADLFVRHLSATCTEVEREARPVTARELLTAFSQGKGVDLFGVIVTGDLLLDSLPQVSGGEWARELSEERTKKELDGVEPQPGSDQVSPVRLIRGPVSIRHSRVKGLLVADSKRSPVVFKGPVTLTHTTFHEPLVLSRSVFLGPVDFSQANLRNESYFVRARFQQPTRFEETSFEIRARFHKAHFRDTVTFRQAVFNGMGEFLEVTFEKNANFSQTVFKLGSGFSGSRFLGDIDFSQSLFEGGAFFTYTFFGQDALFRGTRFRGHTDFSNAHFRGTDQWSNAVFDQEPRFTGANATPRRASPLEGLPDPPVLYAIATALAILTLVFLLIFRTK